ncbi:hypothetical protein BSL78_10059 [Apostichopus japonicus]|uniref:G-protein coupled receptor n=1 Tax=Stichopus japonicus TaxID=307972 RepID=A0A2G8KYJ8_STIJA|nr:hypothetical protein BSL78_10059 [Apostichopus japonicus]
MAAAWIYSLQCDATLDEFLSYLQQNITIVPDNVEDISMQLANATNLFDNSGTNTSLVLTAEIINNIANINSSSPRVTGNVTVTVSNVLNGEDMVLAESYVNGTTTMLIEAFERQLQMVETDSDGIYSQSSENVIVMINDGSPTMLDGFGIATLEVENDDNEDETQTFEEFMVFDSSVQNVQQIVNQSSSLLLYPSQISQNFLSTDSIRIANTVYRRPNLFSSRYYDNINNEFSKYQRRIKRRLVPNTRVISSTLYRNGNEVLTWNRSRGSGNENSTFQQWYLPLQEGGRRAILESSLCSFWNFRADGGRGNWSTDGCRLVSAGSDGMVNCECTHLTNFAVLMDVYDGDSLTETQLLILDAMTFFGCGASILGLLLTILAFSTDSKLRSKRPNHILLGLSTSLTILYVTFLIMALLDSERKKVFLNDVPCTLLAAFMQFSLLSALSWMTVESVLMFYLFVRVFNTAAAATRGFLLKAFAFALGVPLLIVGATYGITTWAGGQYIRKDV